MVTPNLANLAREGVILKQFYSQVLQYSRNLDYSEALHCSPAVPPAEPPSSLADILTTLVSRYIGYCIAVPPTFYYLVFGDILYCSVMLCVNV